MKENIFSLENKTALITGASRGIGKEIALLFASFGCDVIVSSRKIEDLEKVSDEIKKMGRNSKAIACNIGKMEDIKNLVDEAIKDFPKIDILVNNAATNPIFCPILDVEEKAFDKIMDTNLKGYFFTSLYIGKIMIKQGGGNIINISSTSGIKPVFGLGVYGISKAGVIMLTKILASEWAQYNIRVNAVAPGLVKTKFSEVLWSTPEILQEALRHISLKRIAEPSEIAGSVLYLASSASSYVTGETIVISGGG